MSEPSNPAERLPVRRTAKLFIGGQFPRSESGRSYPVVGAAGGVLAQASQASRKDVRDAVVAARGAFSTWSAATAYLRGQVLYRVAELLEGRREQLVQEVADAEDLRPAAAAGQVDAAIDTWVWWAGWTDKLAQVAGSANPVAGPYFNFSLPEPVGVVAVVAPGTPSLLGLVAALAPVLVPGNTAVVVASQAHPLPAVTLGEVLATADLPPGAVNLLTGLTAELAPVLAAHGDIDAIDLGGIDDAAALAELERAGADNLKRVLRPGADDHHPARALAFCEIKTVWHPIGV